ncbi:hypothetical protein BDV93DRAFT_553849 [Ceratobasidium sp. AG-I]|nr:hypothetical protein BDV93DRAFT_553849 [Ceratobasidium sp. AG-I]
MLCNTIPSNPDIAGLGVRLAIYAQTFFFWLMAYKFPKHRDVISSRTLLGMNCSIILSAAIQTASKQGLSLIDTLIVSMMSYILQTVRSSITGGDGVFDNVFFYVSSSSTAAWGIFVWANIKKCESEVVFVLFGRSIPVATHSLQNFAFFYFAYIGVNLIIDLPFSRYMGGIVKGHKPLPEGFTVDNALQAVAENSWAVGGIWLFDVFMSFLGLVKWCTILAIIEQTILRNNQREALSQWSFGQTLALTTALLGIFQGGSEWKNLWEKIIKAEGTRSRVITAIRPHLNVIQRIKDVRAELERKGNGDDKLSSKGDVENGS